MSLKLWLWWELFTKLKPFLQIEFSEEKIKKLEAKLKDQMAEREKEEKRLKY
jgi:hypothetical protein